MASIRRPAKIAALAAVGLGLSALSAVTARASDDSGPFGAIAGAMGFDQNKSGEQIDYRERPRLVVPPDRNALPAPRGAEARPASFPVDQGGVRRQGSRPTVSASAAGEPARETLTQPPSGYRQPTKDLSKLRDPDQKSTSWWNPLNIGNPLSGITKNIGLGE
jgi:hypothetical protein